MWLFIPVTLITPDPLLLCWWSPEPETRFPTSSHTPPPFFFRTIFSSDLFFSREDCMFDESCRDSIKQALWTKTTLSSRSHTQCLGMVFPYLKAYHVMQAVGCVWATAGFWKLHRTILNFPGLSDWTSALCFSHLPRRPQGQVNPNSVPTAPKSQLEM